MTGLKRRLEVLERQSGDGLEAAVSKEALGRVTDEDLDRLESALVCAEAGEDPTGEDRAVLARVETIREEVTREMRDKNTKGARPMTEEHRREIQTPIGTVLVNDVAAGETPPPEALARVRRDLERSTALKEAEANLRTEQKARDREARFAEDLERHLEDRRRFHALKGVPDSVFEAELRPEVERKFLAG